MVVNVYIDVYKVFRKIKCEFVVMNLAAFEKLPTTRRWVCQVRLLHGREGANNNIKYYQRYISLPSAEQGCGLLLVNCSGAFSLP